MYLCKIIKHDVNSKEYHVLWERIGRNGTTLLAAAKKMAKKLYGSKKCGSKLTAFTSLDGYKKALTEGGDESHQFYHGMSTVFSEFGKAIFLLEIAIRQVDEIQ